MGMLSMASSALGGFTSNIMSIATADQRAKQARDQYETQARLSEYNRQVMENQAIAERQSAKQAELAAKTQKGQRHDANAILREKQLALMAKSGVSMAGTPILVAEDQLAEMKLKENDILYQGYLQSREHQNRASFFDAKADMEHSIYIIVNVYQTANGAKL